MDTAEVYHALGCDIEDWLENSRRMSEKSKGRYEAMKEVSLDLTSILPPAGAGETEQVAEIRTKLSRYLQSQTEIARDRMNWQKGFERAVETFVATLGEKYKSELEGR